MSKLYSESALRPPANAATLNPHTGRDQGISDGSRAIVKSPHGELSVQVIFDPAVMPGTIQMVGQPVSPASIRPA